MLKVNIEFRKGILFVRLNGSLNKTTGTKLSTYLTPLIINYGIRYLVINLNNISYANKKGIYLLEKTIKNTELNNGISLICNSKYNINKYMNIDNELSAIKIINI